MSTTTSSNNGLLQDGELGAGVAFLIGWGSRAIATAIVYPLFRLRYMKTVPDKDGTTQSIATVARTFFTSFIVGDLCKLDCICALDKD